MMRVGIGSHAMRVSLAAGLAAMAAACHTPTNPVVPAGQAGYDAIAVAPGTQLRPYLLYPGDIISVRVYDEPEISSEQVVIDNGGHINLPLIGNLHAAGKTPQDLASEVQAALAANYVRDPRVSVQVNKSRVDSIVVEGQVNLPGVFPYDPGQTLLTALALAHSPTDNAKLDEVMIFRTIGDQPSAGRFDIKAIRDGRMPDVALMPNDKVVVGFSAARALFTDVSKILPVFGIFRPYN